jgi:hypothetical protein
LEPDKCPFHSGLLTGVIAAQQLLDEVDETLNEEFAFAFRSGRLPGVSP